MGFLFTQYFKLLSSGRSSEQFGAVRSSSELLGAARSSSEQLGAARSSSEQFGAARSSSLSPVFIWPRAELTLTKAHKWSHKVSRLSRRRRPTYFLISLLSGLPPHRYNRVSSPHNPGLVKGESRRSPHVTMGPLLGGPNVACRF